jgi:hypothetical protein
VSVPSSPQNETISYLHHFCMAHSCTSLISETSVTEKVLFADCIDLRGIVQLVLQLVWAS